MDQVVSDFHMMFSLNIKLEYSGFNHAYGKWVYDHHKVKLKVGDTWPGFKVPHETVIEDTRSKFLKYLGGDDTALTDTREHLIYGDSMTCTCNMKIWNNAGKVEGLSFSLIDSPGLKRMSYTKSEVLNLELVAENVRNSVVICDANRKVQYVNPGFVRLTGYTFEEVKGRSLSFLQGPDTDPDHIAQMNKALKDQVYFSIEIKNYRKSGEPFWSQIYITPHFDQHGKLSKFIGIQTDISQRKEYEGLIKKNEARYWAVINSLHEGLVVQAPDDRVIIANESAGKILGLTREQLLGKDSYDPRWKAMNADGTELKPEEHPSMVTLKTGKPVEDFLMNIHTGKGERKIISINSMPVHDEVSELVGVVVSFLDVTKEIETRKELKESEERYRLLVENAPVGILLHVDGKIKFCNSYASKILEDDTRTKLINKSFFDIIHPDYRHIAFERYDKLKNGKHNNLEIIEEKLLTLSKQEIHVLKSGIPISYKGDQAFLSIFSDITKIRETEAIIKANQERISNIANDISGVLLQYKLNTDGTDELLYISDQVLEVWEVTKEAAMKDVGVLWATFFEEDLLKVKNSVVKSAEDLSPWDQTWRIKTKSGKIKWFNGRGQPIKQSGGSVIWDTIIFDITELKETQIQLEETNNQLQLGVNAANLGIYTYDVLTKEYYWNDILFEMYNISQEEFEANPNCWLDKLHPEDAEEVKEKFFSMLEGKSMQGVKFRMKPTEDSIMYLQASGVPLFDHLGKVFRLVGIDMDITDFVKKEHELEEAIKQKDTLLKELHHRIKNNLNLISSLLYFKSNATKDQALLDYIKETKTRINTIARTHDQLLKLEEFDQLDVKDYLEDLIISLIASYTTDGSTYPLDVTIESQKLSVDKILVLGLLTNEIILNTIKYAYEPGVGGPIFVKLKRLRKGMQLVIYDKGKGIENEVDSKDGITSGLDLIELLVQQLKGSITKNTRKGVKYTIEFSPDE